MATASTSCESAASSFTFIRKGSRGELTALMGSSFPERGSRQEDAAFVPARRLRIAVLAGKGDRSVI